MGNNTVALILNDFAGEIERAPDLGKQIARAKLATDAKRLADERARYRRIVEAAE